MTMTMDDDGAILVHLTNPGGIVGGTGVANQITYWTDTNTIGGDPGLTYDAATDTITVAGNILMADDKFIGIGAAAERIIFDAAGDISFMGCDVGIETTEPSSRLQVRRDHAFTSTTSPWVNTTLTLENRNETTDNYISQTFVSAANGASTTVGAILVKITDHSAGSSNGDMYFGTTLNNTYSTKMIIKDSGNVGIGTIAPLARLHVDQSSASGAIPVLYLDQADVSEPFTNYVGTSAASAANSLSSWTTGNAAQGHIQIDVNGVKRWLRFYDDPTS